MLNTVIVMGRLAADPELKTTPSGLSVTSFSLAVNRGYSKSGEERKTDWIDVVAWRNTAEFVCKYFSKGQMMVVEGSIQTRTYEDKNGSKHKAVEIVARNITFGESKRSSGSESAYVETTPSYQTKKAETKSQYAPGSLYRVDDDSMIQLDINEEDLPF